MFSVDGCLIGVQSVSTLIVHQIVILGDAVVKEELTLGQRLVIV
jgi:hypothetical protein